MSVVTLSYHSSYFSHLLFILSIKRGAGFQLVEPKWGNYGKMYHFRAKSLCLMISTWYLLSNWKINLLLNSGFSCKTTRLLSPPPTVAGRKQSSSVSPTKGIHLINLRISHSFSHANILVYYHFAHLNVIFYI